jgi:hypothetical protein
MQYIDKHLQECLARLGLSSNECQIIPTNCEGIRSLLRTQTNKLKDKPEKVPGVYIFIDGNRIIYIGEANNIVRRVGNEHCKARIGASEGVARFLMYLLNEVCVRSNEWTRLSVVNREEYVVKNILIPIITKSTILIITCPQLKDSDPRHKLEKCLIEELKPILQT